MFQKQKKLNEQLIDAAMSGNLEDVKKTIFKGANVHAKDNQALVYASAYNHIEVIKYLIEQGADVHARYDQSLIDASAFGYLETVKYFILEHGCDIQIALDTAEDRKQDEVFEWCEKYINAKKLNEQLENDLSSNTDKINSKKMKI